MMTAPCRQLASAGSWKRAFLSHFPQSDAGQLTFGAANDVNLYRQDGNTLKTDDDLRVVGAIVAGPSGIDLLAWLLALQRESLPCVD